MGAVPKNRLGIASGVQATTRNVGMVFGIALGGSVFAARLDFHQLYGGAHPFLSAISDAYLAAAVTSALTAVVLLMPRGKA